MEFERLGIMLDCSRNGVLKVPSVKQYIDMISRLGYNCLMLYTEDTYQIEGQPFFGYLRGRYTQEELRELDAYAAKAGVELIPCIQTLAHLNAIVRWSAYKPYTDVNDILLSGDPRTYDLIEEMFCTLEQSFTSRVVNIGMDEAHMVGLGKYLDAHGFENRFDILLSHLNKVCEIAERHGFKPLMWSDMFFRLANNGVYSCDNPPTPTPAIVEAVPESVGLIYWNYYSEDKTRYDNMIKAHRHFDNELWFAGGFWTWTGFAPKNAMSIARTDAALSSIMEHGIRNAIFTVWGDDGQECSLFAILPALYYTAQRAKGVRDMEQIRAGFYQEFGIRFDDFLLLDMPDSVPWVNKKPGNPDKYMFYNDCFCGYFDCLVPEGFVPGYDACAEKLETLADHPQFGYLFDTGAKLCRFLQHKFTIGVRTRQIYKTGDRAGLQALVAEYAGTAELLDAFYLSLRARWMRENKPFGFDVQDIRIGGLKQRILHCRQRLEDYLAGKIDRIEELEEEILPEFDPEIRHNVWASQVTAGALSIHYVAR